MKMTSTVINHNNVYIFSQPEFHLCTYSDANSGLEEIKNHHFLPHWAHIGIKLSDENVASAHSFHKNQHTKSNQIDYVNACL